MKKILLFSIPLFFLCSCQRNTTETWEDVKTAGSYIKKSVRALFGNEADESRQLASNQDFSGPEQDDFIPLEDADLSSQKFAREKPIPQPAYAPGKSRSTTSGMDQFKDPVGKLKSIFRALHFETDNHVVKERDDLVTVARIANYLKKTPKAYLVIEGHCDQRASADYNLALGMRRAQHIRVLLTKQGVNPDKLYTISYGKEKPVSLGSSKQDYFRNRRAQFKLFVKE